MLEASIKEQLKNVFAPLSREIELAVKNCSDLDKGQELMELLNEVASTSSKINIKILEEKSEVPQFTLALSGETPRMSVTGIPGGHEFTTLVLSILYLDQKGRRPDQNIVNKIKNLKGPLKLRTFISLSCENCPEVVQALNLMTTLHPQFEHEMIDGAFAQSDIDRLGIQGVPAVFSGDKLLHVGKSTLGELLEKLVAHFGISNSSQEIQDLGHFEMTVIGGGPAGASAAIYSSRKGIKTALIADRIGGQMQFTKGIENFISVAYTEGPQLSDQLFQHLSKYPVQVFEQRRVSKIEGQTVKKITLSTGETLSTDTLLVATGAKWRELNVPGEGEYLGRGVAYCPHCDGPFYKDKVVAVVGGGNSGIEAAIDLAGIVKHVTLIEFQSQLKGDEILLQKLKNLPNVSVVLDAQTRQVIGDGKKVTALEYLNKKENKIIRMDLDGIFVQIGLIPNSQFLKGIVELNNRGEIVVDDKGRTSTPGIYAAGDVTTTPFKQIVIAMGEGAKVALAAYEDSMRKLGA